MSRVRRTFSGWGRGASIVGVVGLSMSSGCGNDLKTQLQTLEEDKRGLAAQLDEANQRLAEEQQANQRLSGDLTRSGGDLSRLNSDAARLSRELAQVRQENQQLQRRLAELSKAPAPQSAPPPGWKTVQGGAMIAIEGTVLFRAGEAKLRDESLKALDAIAQTLNTRYAGKDVMIVGHTDDTPIQKSGWDDNYELSCQRALAVARHLAKRSVAPKRLVPAGCGEHRPQAPNSSATNRQANRRVEIFALDAPLGK